MGSRLWVKRTVIGIRIFLAVVALVYGSIKLLGGQFYYGDWTIDKKTVGGPFLVWAFYGYSPLYGRIVGLFELIPGLMLLFPRTATLGAAALFAVLLNITVMDFAFGFPSVKYFSLLYTMLCALLLLYDYKKLSLIFWSGEDVAALASEATRSRRASPMTKKPLSRGALAAIILLLVPLILFALNLIGAAIVPGPEGMAENYLVNQGWEKQNLRLLNSRYTGLLGIGRTADIRFEVQGTNPPEILHVVATRASGFVGWKIQRADKEPGVR